MRTLAEFIMRSRAQAALVVVLSAALPLLFWVSAAASSLVLLRRGFKDAFVPVMWALLPALVWWYLGEATVVMAIAGTLVAAEVLRRTASWQYTLLASVVVGMVYGGLLSVTYSDQIAALAGEMQKLLPKVLGNNEAYKRLTVEQQQYLGNMVSTMLTGVLAALLQMVTIGSLMLGRYWQALLYNPGGFGSEFRSLRLSPAIMVLLLVGTLLPNFAPGLLVLTPVCSVPLAFAGLALIHGLGVTRPTLVLLYVLIVMFLQVVYPLLVVLAILDSLLDFRGRRAANGGPGPREG